MKQFRYTITGQSVFIQPSNALPFTLRIPTGIGKKNDIQNTALLQKKKQRNRTPGLAATPADKKV